MKLHNVRPIEFKSSKKDKVSSAKAMGTEKLTVNAPTKKAPGWELIFVFTCCASIL